MDKPTAAQDDIATLIAPSPLADFVAGTVAGAASLLVGHPLDTIKVRVQLRNDANKSSSWDVFKTIVRDEKMSGLFKGVMSPMLGVAAVNASVFSTYGAAMRWQLSSPSDSPSLLQVGIAGSFSGVLTSAITTPIERLKILQQCAPTSAPQPTLLHLVRNLPVRSLYRGLGATMLRDLGYGPYFAMYEAVSRGWPGVYGSDLYREVESESRDVSWSRLLLAGGAAGIMGWGITFPFDVIKSRIQASEPYLPLTSSTSPSSRIAHPFRTIRSTMVNSYKAEGLKVFTAGLGPTLMRSVPVNMVCFFVFEAVVGAFR